MTTLTFSHGIVSHSTDTGLPNGTQNFLDINSNKVDLHAPIDQQFVAVFAHRDTNYLITLQSSSDIEAWGYGSASEFNEVMDNVNGGGTGSNKWYLYIEIDRATGQVSYGHSIYEPSTGSIPPFSTPPSGPSQRPDDIHWFDTTSRTMKVWRATGLAPFYGKWVEVIRVFVAEYTYSASFASMSVNSPSYIGTTVGLTGSFKSGSLVFDVIGNPLIRTTSDNHSVFFTTEDVFLTGMPSVASPVSGNRARYETFLVDAIGMIPQSAYTMVQFDDFNEVTPLQAGNEETKIWGMTEFPVGVSGDLIQVTMSGVVRNPFWDWSTVGQQIFVNKNSPGVLTTNTANVFPDQLPIGVVIDRTAILLRRPELALVSTTGVVTDHGALAGLDDDDHTIYILANGTRAFSGDIDLSTNNITNVGNVDGIDISTLSSNYTSHAADNTIHFTEGSIDHTAISNIGTNTHAQIDTHIADSTIHFTEGSIDHTSISNIGTNTHAQIDTHIADSTIHFSTLSGLSDVASGSPAASIGDVLTWDGSQWEPRTLDSALTLYVANKPGMKIYLKMNDSAGATNTTDETGNFSSSNLLYDDLTTPGQPSIVLSEPNGASVRIDANGGSATAIAQVRCNAWTTNSSGAYTIGLRIQFTQTVGGSSEVFATDTPSNINNPFRGSFGWLLLGSVEGADEGKIRCYVNSGSSGEVHATSSTRLDDNVARNIIVTWDGNGDGRARLYIDGVLDAISSGSFTGSNGAPGDLRVGGGWSSIAPESVIDEFFYSTEVWDASEIAEHQGLINATTPTSIGPYDLVVQAFNTLGTTVPLIIFHMIAVRPFRISGETDAHIAHCITGPTGSDASFTLFVNNVPLGTGSPSETVTFTTAGGNNQTVTFTLSQTDVLVGDIIDVKMTTADTNDVMENITITINATNLS